MLNDLDCLVQAFKQDESKIADLCQALENLGENIKVESFDSQVLEDPTEGQDTGKLSS